ncbi:MAG: ECF-type sigma factor [Isosphaeraceae bacterium]
METGEAPVGWTSLVLLERFRHGDDQAAEALVSRYFERLTLLARSRFSPRLAGRSDPEDIVLSVYRSFFVGARDGRFTLKRGGDLWRLLASITKHKLLRQVRYHRAECRSVDLEMPIDRVDEGRIPGHQREPTPEESLALADELEYALSRSTPFERRILELRLQGAQISDIAAETGRSERTVRRTLDHIRELLAERFDHDGP